MSTAADASPAGDPFRMTSAEELKTELLKQASADVFAVSYLQLCRVSYDLLPSAIPADVANPKTVYPWGDGHWQCTWGPALDPVQANLVYVATYYQAGLPVALVVVIRGTDLTDDVWGDLWEAFEDLSVAFQTPLPWLVDPNIMIAEGTLGALDTLMGLTSNGQNLLSYLLTTLGNPINQNPVLIVTGHSLGGCMASVAAPWLKVSLNGSGINNPIVPVTFAAPTAGNAGFADYYTKQFPYCPRYYNDLDVVPRGWENLAGVKTVYQQCGLTIPFPADLVVNLWQDAMNVTGASYAQPAAMRAPLPGACFTTSDWYSELGFQHATTTYLALIGVTAPQTALANTLPARSNRPLSVSRRVDWLTRQQERTPAMARIVAAPA